MHSYSSITSAVPFQRMHLDQASDKRSGSWGIVLVVQMSWGDGRSTLADVVSAVADSLDLRGSDAAEGLATLWVTEDDNGSDLGGVRSSSLLGSVVHKLSTLTVSRKDDLGVRATAGGLSQIRLLSVLELSFGLTELIRLVMVVEPLASPPARKPATLAEYVTPWIASWPVPPTRDARLLKKRGPTAAESPTLPCWLVPRA